jgi:hypothetical protein
MYKRLQLIVAVGIGIGALWYNLPWAAFFNFGTCCWGSPAQGSVEVSGFTDDQQVVIDLESSWSFVCIGPKGQVVNGTASNPGAERTFDEAECQNIGNGRRLCTFEINPPPLVCNGQPGTGFEPSAVPEFVFAKLLQVVCADPLCTTSQRTKAAADATCVNLNDPKRDPVTHLAIQRQALTCDTVRVKVTN